MPSRRSVLATEVVTIVVCCAFFFFYGLGSFGLVGADEPRYAQIAREMLARHDWVTPVLNGVPWLEKPVFYYWSAMVSYSIFGVSDWAARLPTAVLTTLMVLATYFFMRRSRPGSQLHAALILISCAGIIGFARAASTDMPLTVMFAIGLLCWYTWYEKRQRVWLFAFYAFMALGTLAKGPVAPFLAALIIILFAVLRRDWKVILDTLAIGGVLFYLAIALPWYVLVQHANPQFVRLFILEQNLARYGSNKYQHHQPLWYFGPVLLLALLPWIVFALCGIVKALRRHALDSFGLFFALWAAVPVIFFSFSGSKLPGYILPAIPPFAILAGDYIDRRMDESAPPAAWIIALHSFLTAALLGGALLTIHFVMHAKPSALAIGIASCTALAMFVFLFVSIQWRGLRIITFATLVPMVVALGFVLKVAAPYIDAKNSTRLVADRVNQLTVPLQHPAIAVLEVPRQVEYGLNFYENQPVSRYERGEIPMGAHIVVGRPNSAAAVASYSKRNVLDLGSFPAQRLEFYYVSAK